MAETTKIQWTDAVWNPTTGCTKISSGCANCYIERTPPFRMAGRKFVGGKIPLELHEDRLDKPLHWRKPRRVFVNSLSDLFHDDVPNEFIASVFGVMASCPQHTFQVLTKRPERMAEWFNWLDVWDGDGGPSASWYPFGIELAKHGIATNETLRRAVASHPRHMNRERDLYWPLPNVWLGVSVEDQQRADERIPHLLRVPATVRFLSVEPMLGPIELEDMGWLGCETYHSTMATPDGSGIVYEHGVDWVIVGGESGNGARPCSVEWIRDIVRQCKAAGVSCFVKQLGSDPYHVEVLSREPCSTDTFDRHYSLKDKKGGDPSEWDADLRVREMPKGAWPSFAN